MSSEKKQIKDEMKPENSGRVLSMEELEQVNAGGPAPILMSKPPLVRSLAEKLFRVRKRS